MLGDGLFINSKGVNESFKSFPLVIKEPLETFTVRFDLEVGRLTKTTFDIQPDDCINSIQINGSPVPHVGCTHPLGQRADLSPFLKRGTNKLELSIKNRGGPTGFNLRGTQDDYISIFLIVLFIGAAWFVAHSASNSYLKKTPRLVLYALTVTIIIRLLYVLCTPYYTRAHDWSGHWDYIEFFTVNWSVPRTSAGWEFYHPPLYYGMGAVVSALCNTVGLDPLFSLQMLAFSLSSATMLVVTVIALNLFRFRALSAALFIALIGTVPALIFQASRINNDVLFQFLAFLALHFLIVYWKRGDTGSWYRFSFVLAVGLLTKSNAALLIPIATALLFLRPNITLRKKIISALSTVLVCFLLCGWLYAKRYIEDGALPIIGNIATLNQKLVVPNNLKYLVIFNPIKMLQAGYINPWEDSSRRQFFWEYLYRSAIAGEFNFGEKFRWLTLSIMLVGIGAVLISLRGAITNFKYYGAAKYLPMWVTLLFTMVLHVLHRLENPYSSVQDFRFVPFIIVPIAFYAVQGYENSKRFLAHVTIFVFGCFMALSILFMLLLYFEPAPFSV